MSITTFMAHQALSTGSELIDAFGRTGTYSINMLAGNLIPPAESLIHLGVTGMIDERSMQEGLLRHGISLTVAGDPQTGQALGAEAWVQELWNQHYFAAQELPSPEEIFQLTNRGILSDGNMDRLLERRGFQSQSIRTAVENLRYDIPGSSDLVRFSVRHVFEPDLIAALGYNEEFRPILDFWHRTQGLNYPLFSGPFSKSIEVFEQQIGLPPGTFLASYREVGLGDPTWAQAYWWSHWVLPSPTQGYEMLFRLRPDRNRAFDPPQARGIDFTPAQLELLLRANDYPPAYRAPLAAIAYRVPGIRFLRQLRSTDTFEQNDVVELLLRQGYSEGDAKVLAASVERADKQARRRQIETESKATLGRYWELGIITDDDYLRLLVQHGLTPADAQETLALAQVDLKYQRIRKIVTAVHKKYIRGEVNDAQAANLLHQAGINADRAGQLLEDWRLELSPTRKTISAQHAQKMACQGLMTLADLAVRLKNLGYPDQDVAALVAEALVCQQGRATQAAEKSAKARQAQILALQRQQKEAAQAIQAARRQLAAHGSPAQLRKWYCAGHIGQAEVYSRLDFLGWPVADIERLLADCSTGSGKGSGGPRGGPNLPVGPP